MHHVVEGHHVYVVHHVEVVPAFEGVHHVMLMLRGCTTCLNESNMKNKTQICVG